MTCPGNQVTLPVCLDFCLSVYIDLSIDPAGVRALTANLIEMPFQNYLPP